jgi:hypothetical protein
MRQVNLGEFELARLEFRFDLFDKMQIGLLRRGIISVTRHRDIALRPSSSRPHSTRRYPESTFEISGGLHLGSAASSRSNKGSI